LSVDKRRRRSTALSLGPRFSEARSTSGTTSSSWGSLGAQASLRGCQGWWRSRCVPGAAVQPAALDANHAVDAEASQGMDPRVPRPRSGHSRADGERRAPMSPMWMSVPIRVAAVAPIVGVGWLIGRPPFLSKGGNAQSLVIVTGALLPPLGMIVMFGRYLIAVVAGCLHDAGTWSGQPIKAKLLGGNSAGLDRQSVLRR
jgi:hypothetical protein